jgi:Arc/MetJ-type ribon-helix-helix transcriptional regulator
MTIYLPASLESSILEVVHSGRFASLDDAMAEAARLLLQHVKHEPRELTSPVTDQQNPAQAEKPIWEEILELTADVPDEEWDKLPTDLAEQHDHYIYGTPKRPPTQ